MSDIHNAPAGGEGVSAPPVSTPADTSPITPSQAARALAQRRVEKMKEQQAAPDLTQGGITKQLDEGAPAQVEQPQELAETPIDAQPTADPVEVTETPEPAELPPIEPPRSWTKEEKEEFATYPREAQEKIARREQERESALRRSQNEAAEARKAVDADRAKAEQVRQQYEQALPALLQTLQEQQQGEFSDIKTMADVEKLAREDWPRYALWDAQQKKIAAVASEVKATQDRQAQEFKTRWSEYASKQDQLLNERAPELADKAKAKKIAETAQDVLKDIGFNDQELAQAWNGEASISLRDHRVQLLILDAVKYREAKASTSKPTPKPLPPVQRPGVAAPRNAAQVQQVQTLSKKLDQTGSLKDAAALLTARRAAQR